MALQINESTVDTVAVSVTNKSMLGGAIAGAFGWMAQINWIGLSGVLIALLGLAVNFYFQHRRDKREQAESLARIDAMRERCGLEGRQQ
ncbi:holin [Ectopseudomonas mendocina]|nr:holin [Pseudomonas mendocina]